MTTNVMFGSTVRTVKDASGNVTGLSAGGESIRVRVNALAENIICHRGFGSLVAPDNSMSAYKAAYAAGFKNIEMDVNLLADGGLGCMHDTTIDRTTTGTGNVADLTTAEFKALTMDPASFLAPPWPPEAPPTFEEVLREFGNTDAILWPEAKNTGSGKAIVMALLRNVIAKDRVIIQSFTLSELSPVIDAGYKAAYGVNPATADFTAIAAAGVSYVFWSSWSSGQATSAKAVGLTPIIYTINRRSDYAAAVAIGVDMAFSDDPLWVSGLNQVLTFDPFVGQTWMPGMFYNVVGQWQGGNKYGYSTDVTTTFQGTMQGWGCPVKNNDNCDDFVIDLTINIISSNNEINHADFFICSNNDRSFTDSPTDLVNGYNLLVRKNGYLQIYKKVSGSAIVKIAETIGGTALSLDTNYAIKITVTPTSITLKNVTLDKTVTVNDSDFRGGYFYIGRRDLSVSFSGITIS